MSGSSRAFGFSIGPGKRGPRDARIVSACETKVGPKLKSCNLSQSTGSGSINDQQTGKSRSTFRDAAICACGSHGFIGLTFGKVAFFSAEDIGKVSGRKWRALRNRSGVYAGTSSAADGNRIVYLHRVIAQPDARLVVDHINRDPLDNTRQNLRVCTQAENARNAAASRSNLHGFKGVSRVTAASSAPGCAKYFARIAVDSKTIHLGVFGTPEEAARAYDRAALIYHGEFAATNVGLGLLPAIIGKTG